MMSGPPRPAQPWPAALDRGLDAITHAVAVLALPLSLLLFLQWPLRELVQAYSREANDAAHACLRST